MYEEILIRGSVAHVTRIAVRGTPIISGASVNRSRLRISRIISPILWTLYIFISIWILIVSPHNKRVARLSQSQSVADSASRLDVGTPD